MSKSDMQEDQELLQERYTLSTERIASIKEEIKKENQMPEPFQNYFQEMASFLMQMQRLAIQVETGELKENTLEQWKHLNYCLYEDILPQNYDTSYGNPSYAVSALGEVHGKILSFVYSELRGMIVYAFEKRMLDMAILNELFIEIYNCFQEEELPSYRTIQQIVYWFVSDYSDCTAAYRIREAVDPDLDFAAKLVMESDLQDLRYLYEYGEYVTENELETARYLNILPQKEIERIASAFTEGYRMGFVLGHKDLSKKKTVNIRYRLGFERIIRQAAANFTHMGLRPVLYRAAVNSINKRQQHRTGYYGAIPNQQYDYDHRADQAIYLDKAFIERKLGVLQAAYQEYKELAGVHAGPACVETFGEVPFIPQSKADVYRLSEKQQKLSVLYDRESAQITNQYIKGEERSFTIIAFPVPEIGSAYREIFNEVVKINTLDYQLYQNIQQTIIDALDDGYAVHIQGRGENKTDLTVRLHTLNDRDKETNFENCVADVNIPVGEVFTSPVLAGTDGILEVGEVYLNGLRYEHLHIEFRDGMIENYTCGNFDTEEENRRYILENVLFHHETLPMGEFAIGTNTTAYVMAQKYQIADKLPILIAEKTGPHFAVGDTCYSWSEDIAVCNPDGKEIIARDNEWSIRRKEDLAKAYLGCHTDITIPYHELGHIRILKEGKTQVSLIEDGRFVLEGTQELNRPFHEENRTLR